MNRIMFSYLFVIALTLMSACKRLEPVTYNITVADKDINGVWILTDQCRNRLANELLDNQKSPPMADATGAHTSGKVGQQTCLMVFTSRFWLDSKSDAPSKIGIMECFPFGGRIRPFSTTIPFTWTLNSPTQSSQNIFTPLTEPIQGARVWLDINYWKLPDKSTQERFYLCKTGAELRILQKSKKHLLEWKRLDSESE